MLRFEVLTLFPDIFSSFIGESLIKRAIEKELLSVSLVNFRKHGLGKHLQVDDSPYGGGPGMILRIEPVDLTLEEQKNFIKARDVRHIQFWFHRKDSRSLKKRQKN